MSNQLEKLIYYFFPHWQLNNTPWKSLWLEKCSDSILYISRIAFLFLIFAYPVHYFFVDTPLGLTIDNSKWLYYRFGLATLSLFFLILTFTPLKKINNFVLFLFLINGLIICYCQSLSLTWYNEVSYLWGILFAVIFSALIPLPTMTSLIYTSLCLYVQLDFMESANVSTALIYGAFSAALFVLFVLKSRLTLEVSYFIKENDSKDAQMKSIELQQDLNAQIFAFLPKKIRDRLQINIANKKNNIIHAIDEILRPQKKDIVAMYSDIRGFTQNSKNIEYLESSAIPNMKVSVEIIENYGGIPRQIGDLVFSYFDENNTFENIKNSFLASAEILDLNEKMNSQVSEANKIRRYILLDIGLAIVGNIGGLKSAREVTAMGTCVNKLSRIDILTKNEDISKELSFSAIVMTSEIGEIVKSIFPKLIFQKLDLKQHGLKIKDFPEINNLLYFRLSDQIFLHQEKESA